jgi:signal transduction histidine kinase
VSRLSRLSGSGRSARLRGLLGPRPWVLVGSAALVLSLLGVSSYVVLDSQQKSRRDAEKQFAVEARVAAQLTGSLFASAIAPAQQQAAKTFSGARPLPGQLAATVKRSRLAYALILDGSGKLLAASPGAPVAARARSLDGSAVAVQHALAGQPWLSDVFLGVTRTGGVIEWALPFQTRFGRRVEVEGLNTKSLSLFLAGYLAKIDGGTTGRGYVIDSTGRVIAQGGGKPTGSSDRSGLRAALVAVAGGRNGRFHVGEGQQLFTSAPVAGSTWRVVLSEPPNSIYPAVVGPRKWLLFAVLAILGLAGVASLVFLRRSFVNGAELALRNHELATVNTTLEERVAERTAAAEERARELARSNAELEQFASVTSHDLQEPLRKIRMFGDRLQSRLGDNVSTEAASDLGRMQSAARRMQRLIEDLLAFSRVTTRGRSFEPVDLQQVTRDVITDLEARIVEVDARIELAELPVLEADATQMRQLMQNLISNALKFHRAGVSPVVRIEGSLVAANAPRFAAETTECDHCLITVSDNGIGFDEKYAERVFAAFERLNGNSEYDGTGIGLSIAQKIVWRHGGDISATSTPGEGSTFTIRLPLNHGEAETGYSEKAA